VLSVAQRYGTGTLVWSPLAKGMLTGRVRKGQPTDLRRAAIFTSFSDERRLDAVERIIPIGEQAGLPMTHLAMAFAIAHPGVTSALIGPLTMEQLDDLLAGADVRLTDDLLDRIDEIVPRHRPGRLGLLGELGDPGVGSRAAHRRQHVRR
jgi:aryl-alcohol dehydrogenase-like predicted oxidoreductase